MKGLFITFEGTEGSGKSTQISTLAEKLRTVGAIVQTVREPGGTPVGEEIRRLLKRVDPGQRLSPETELLLMNASRAQLVTEVIQPALDRGEVVLCDRFFDSTVAYQGYGRGLDLDVVQQVISAAVGDLRPDLTLLLHIPVGVSERRRALRAVAAGSSQDRFEEADRGFFERVERGYLALAEAQPGRIHLIPGVESQSAVARAIWQLVEPLWTRSRTESRR